MRVLPVVFLFSSCLPSSNNRSNTKQNAVEPGTNFSNGKSTIFLDDERSQTSGEIRADDTLSTNGAWSEDTESKFRLPVNGGWGDCS